MHLGRSGKLGLVLVVPGALLVLAGQDVLVFPMAYGGVVSDHLPSRYGPFGPNTVMILGGAFLCLLGGTVTFVDLAFGHSGKRRRTPDGREVLFSGHDHDTVPERSFTHYDFSLADPADFTCTVEVLNDQPVNVIVTSEEYRDRFERTTRIKKLEDLTRFDSKRAEFDSRLEPGDWSVIIDNTNRLGVSKRVSGRAEIEIDYEVVQ